MLLKWSGCQTHLETLLHFWTKKNIELDWMSGWHGSTGMARQVCAEETGVCYEQTPKVCGLQPATWLWTDFEWVHHSLFRALSLLQAEQAGFMSVPSLISSKHWRKRCPAGSLSLSTNDECKFTLPTCVNIKLLQMDKFPVRDGGCVTVYCWYIYMMHVRCDCFKPHLMPWVSVSLPAKILHVWYKWRNAENSILSHCECIFTFYDFTCHYSYLNIYLQTLFNNKLNELIQT